MRRCGQCRGPVRVARVGEPSPVLGLHLGAVLRPLARRVLGRKLARRPHRCGSAHQERLLRDLFPDLEVIRRQTVPCVTTYTPSGHPVIDDLTSRVSTLIGGNGYAAKCAPALGELAAGRLLGEPWPIEVDRGPFERAPTSAN